MDDQLVDWLSGQPGGPTNPWKICWSRAVIKQRPAMWMMVGWVLTSPWMNPQCFPSFLPIHTLVQLYMKRKKTKVENDEPKNEVVDAANIDDNTSSIARNSLAKGLRVWTACFFLLNHIEHTLTTPIKIWFTTDVNPFCKHTTLRM